MHKFIKYTVNGVISLSLFLVPFFVGVITFSFDVSTMLTVVSLFFVILIGFFIAATTSNYLRMQTLIADLNAALIGVFENAQKISVAGSKKVADAVDQYMISSLDYQYLESYKKDDLKEIVDAVHLIKPKTTVGHNLYPYLIEGKNALYRIHQELSLASQAVVSRNHWFILLTLSLVIAFLLLGFRDGSLLVHAISGLVLVSIYQTLFLLYEIDRNALLANKLVYVNPQQVFFAIGKLPYYPGGEIKRKWANPNEKKYRVGIYIDYPNSFAKKIKVITRK